MVWISMRNDDFCAANHIKKQNFCTHATKVLEFLDHFKTTVNWIKSLINRITHLKLLWKHSALKMVWISMRNDDFCEEKHYKFALFNMRWFGTSRFHQGLTCTFAPIHFKQSEIDLWWLWCNCVSIWQLSQKYWLDNR